MVEYIYYDGVGAKKSGKHTVKEFLDIMKKNEVMCSLYLPELHYKPCEEYNNLNGVFVTKNNNLVLNSKSFLNNKNSKKYKKFKKVEKKCIKYKKTAKKRKCNLEEYIKYSGAKKENTDNNKYI